MKKMRYAIAFMLVIVLILGLVGCQTAPTTYDSSEDAPFLPENIYSDELYVPGLIMDETQVILEATGKTDVGCFVLEGEFGKCYEVKVPANFQVRAATVPANPREIAVGEKADYSSKTFIKDVKRTETETAFMYVCRNQGEYLVISTGSSDPIYIGKRSILEENDTKGPWYVQKEPIPRIGRGDDAMGDLRWNSEEFIENIYEPYRKKYPDYITRTNIGKDDTGTYDMYFYEFTPKDYEITVFLSGGMHADEQVSYYGLAKVMQLIADAKPKDALLYTLRQKVRFMVFPLINVYGASHGSTRRNGRNEDLNRSFDDMSQQECRNIINTFEPYAEETSFFIDFHTAITDNVSMWFNFINYSDNAVVNYKTTNHMYHRLLELGYAKKEPDLRDVPGSYTKGDQYLEGKVWNNYGVSFLTIEQMASDLMPVEFSSECMTIAVETFVNFIVQNSLFYLQGN